MRILYLCNRYFYLNKMSRVRFHAVQALAKIADVKLSGPGWPGYQDEKSLKENIHSLYSGVRPDFILAYKPFEIRGFSEIDIPTCVTYNEMGTTDHPRDYTLKEIVENRITLVVCHHHNEMLYPQFKEISGRMVSIPHASEESIFRDYGLPKEIDILLVGRVRLPRYPLRVKFLQALELMAQSKQFSNYRFGVLAHPGYRVLDAFTDGEAIRFARAINASKITLTCSGIYRSRYSKFAEIPACRSLLMSDLPDEAHPFFKEFVAEVHVEDSHEALIEKMVYYLEHEKEREELTNRGYEMTHATSTQEHYAKRLLSEMDRVLKDVQ